MDAATGQAKIYRGYAQVAQRLGVNTRVFRPDRADDPFTHRVTTLKASFTAEDFHYRKPRKPGQAAGYGLFDGRQTQAGDYLVQDNGIWFIASQALQLPLLCIACARQVTLRRPQRPEGIGALPYQGRSAATQTVVLGAKAPWPASILLGGVQAPSLTLPAGVKEAGWIVLLPPSVPVVIQPGDRLQDDLQRGYVIDAAELTEVGWRLRVHEAHP